MYHHHLWLSALTDDGLATIRWQRDLIGVQIFGFCLVETKGDRKHLKEKLSSEKKIKKTSPITQSIITRSLSSTINHVLTKKYLATLKNVF
jgi:hypothetical protein